MLSSFRTRRVMQRRVKACACAAAVPRVHSQHKAVVVCLAVVRQQRIAAPTMVSLSTAGGDGRRAAGIK